MQRICPDFSKVHRHQVFENVILFLIFTSSIMLILDNPLEDPNSKFKKVMGVLDKVHTGLFFIEAIIKIIGLGFLHNNLKDQELKPYIYSPWNMIDFLVVLASLIESIIPILLPNLDANDLKTLKAMRAFRALRPLRMVSRNEGMKLVVGALWKSLPSMWNVLIICMLLLFILAIMGVNFFKGNFWHCEGLSMERLETVFTR